jgi:hypothetical protein
MDIVEEIIEILKNAHRHGAEKDEPEGARYIVISDTLANRLVKELKEYLDERWSDGIDAMGEDA